MNPTGIRQLAPAELQAIEARHPKLWKDHLQAREAALEEAEKLRRRDTFKEVEHAVRVPLTLPVSGDTGWVVIAWERQFRLDGKDWKPTGEAAFAVGALLDRWTKEGAAK